jgi:hypothetical protein
MGNSEVTLSTLPLICEQGSWPEWNASVAINSADFSLTFVIPLVQYSLEKTLCRARKVYPDPVGALLPHRPFLILNKNERAL